MKTQAIKTKLTCERCHQRYNKLVKVRGQFLCFHCKRKVLHIIGIATNDKYVQPMKFEKALAKVYEIKGYLVKHGKGKDRGVIASCSFPRIMIGHKFKIQLIK